MYVFPKSTFGEQAAQGWGIDTVKTGTNQSHFLIPAGLVVQHLPTQHTAYPEDTEVGGIEADHSQTDILSWTNGQKGL